MGCTNSRSGKINSMLSTECDDLMRNNLDILRTFECLYIQQQKLNLALSILYIKKRTEQFYKIVQNYRRFWLSDSKSSNDESINLKKLEKCERQQMIEREQLINCQSRLIKLLSELHRDWPKEYSDLSNFLEYLEISPSVTQASTSLYGNFYLCSDKEIKEGILEYGELSSSEKEMLKRIKEVTVEPYKDENKIVYATDRVVIRKRRRKSRTQQPVVHKVEKSVTKEPEVEKVIQKVEEPKMSEGVTKVESVSTTKGEQQEFSDSESSYESYTETDEDDEQYLARLSVSQK